MRVRYLDSGRGSASNNAVILQFVKSVDTAFGVQDALRVPTPRVIVLFNNITSLE
ncbi:MAG TPA: hypothetical protein VHL58_16350 [Thermoanaerobaculia bacterium]|nr:hypothetical protein [Thermoanaerobaculia bacterium]